MKSTYLLRFEIQQAGVASLNIVINFVIHQNLITFSTLPSRFVDEKVRKRVYLSNKNVKV